MTREDAERGLATLEQIYSHPDFATAKPESKAYFQRKETQYRATLRNLDRVDTEMGLAAKRQYETQHPVRASMSSEQWDPDLEEQRLDARDAARSRPAPTTSAPLPEPSLAGELGHQADATAWSALRTVPGFVTALEATGELSDAIGTGGKHNILPRPGDIDQLVESSPSPTAAKVAGAAIPAVTGTGALGGTAAGLSRASMAPATRTYQALAGSNPGAVRQVLAGAGAGAGIGLGEAELRRAPARLTGAPVEPIQPQEVALPAVVGGGLSLPGAIYGAMYRASTNPETPLGATANEYARNVRAGTYKNELAGKMSGKEGVAQVKSEGAERVAAARDQAVQNREALLPERMAPIETANRRGNEALQAAGEDAEAGFSAARGQSAADIAPHVRDNLARLRQQAKDNLDATMRAKDETGVQVPAQRTNQVVDDFIAKQAKSYTQGTSDPLYTPEGQALNGIATKWKEFMGAGGTVGDWVKMIRWLEAQERGQPATARLYREMANIVRHGQIGPDGKPTGYGGLANEDPEIGQAWAGYRSAMGRVERASDILYRQPDTNKLGLSSAHGKVDVPLPGDPYTPQSLMPHEEETLRSRLMSMDATGDAAAARAPGWEEIAQGEFAPEVGAMEGRLANVRNQQRKFGSQMSDAKAELEARTAAEKTAATRQLQQETNAPVRAEVENSRRLVAAKAAQEASRWLSLNRLAEPAMLMSMGLPRSAAHAGAGRMTSLVQPMASRIAIRPPMEGPPVALPGLLGMTLQLNEKKDSTDQASDLVQAARSHAQRFGATIGERLGYQGSR